MATPSVPEPGEGKRGEDGYLGYLLRQAAGSYRLRLERALADLRVTPPQFAVMTMLNAYPGLSNADLARLALLTPQTTGGILANLQKAGLIQRRPHQTHGRILHVALSEPGQALLAACRARVQAIEQDILAGVTPQDAATIRRWLAGLAQPGPGAPGG